MHEHVIVHVPTKHAHFEQTASEQPENNIHHTQ